MLEILSVTVSFSLLVVSDSSLGFPREILSGRVSLLSVPLKEEPVLTALREWWGSPEPLFVIEVHLVGTRLVPYIKERGESRGLP